MSKVEETSGTWGKAWRVGEVVMLFVTAVAPAGKLDTDYASFVAGTLPEGWRPRKSCNAAACVQNLTTNAYCYVAATGVITIQLHGGGGIAGAGHERGCNAAMCYPVA